MTIFGPPKSNAAEMLKAIQYGSLSGISFVVTIITTIGLHEIGLDEAGAFLGALVVATIVNFLGLRFWVFRQDEANALPGQLLGFLTSTGAFRLGDYLLFLAIHTLTDAHYISAVILTLSLSTIAKYFVHRRLFSAPSGKA